MKTYHLEQQKCTIQQENCPNSANNTDKNRIDVPDQFELKIVDIEDNESTTNDSFPPELVPQVNIFSFWKKLTFAFFCCPFFIETNSKG